MFTQQTLNVFLGNPIGRIASRDDWALEVSGGGHSLPAHGQGTHSPHVRSAPWALPAAGLGEVRWNRANFPSIQVKRRTRHLIPPVGWTRKRNNLPSPPLGCSICREIPATTAMPAHCLCRVTTCRRTAEG